MAGKRAIQKDKQQKKLKVIDLTREEEEEQEVLILPPKIQRRPQFELILIGLQVDNVKNKNAVKNILKPLKYEAISKIRTYKIQNEVSNLAFRTTVQNTYANEEEACCKLMEQCLKEKDYANEYINSYSPPKTLLEGFVKPIKHKFNKAKKTCIRDTDGFKFIEYVEFWLAEFKQNGGYLTHELICSHYFLPQIELIDNATDTVTWKEIWRMGGDFIVLYGVKLYDLLYKLGEQNVLTNLSKKIVFLYDPKTHETPKEIHGITYQTPLELMNELNYI